MRALLSASGDCLVRSVAGDDIGIDLYCETLVRDESFLHFWLQVKAGKQCKVSSDRLSASVSLKTEHLRYWARQPVPVFAALVPGDPHVPDPRPVYIVDITAFALENEMPTGKTKTIHSSHIWRAGNQMDIFAFLHQTVPARVALMQCKSGVVAPAPRPTERSLTAFPTAPVQRYQSQILQQIRHTASMSILFLRELDQLVPATEEFRRRLAEVLGSYVDDRHWETHAALAFSAHADGEFEAAAQAYEQAIEIIRSDEFFYGTPESMLYLQGLTGDLERARGRTPIPALWPTSV